MGSILPLGSLLYGQATQARLATSKLQQLRVKLKDFPGKNSTIHSLLENEIPPLKSTDNKPTPYVTPKTIGYIHSLICDSITVFQSDACNTQALCNEGMILEVLEAEGPAVSSQELFNMLEHYYEVILGLPSAGGRPKPKSFKHKMKTAKLHAAEATDLESTEDTAEVQQPAERGVMKEPPPSAGCGGSGRLPLAASKERQGCQGTMNMLLPVHESPAGKS